MAASVKDAFGCQQWNARPAVASQVGVHISQRTGSLEAAVAGRAELLSGVVKNWSSF